MKTPEKILRKMMTIPEKIREKMATHDRIQGRTTILGTTTRGRTRERLTTHGTTPG